MLVGGVCPAALSVECGLQTAKLYATSDVALWKRSYNVTVPMTAPGMTAADLYAALVTLMELKYVRCVARGKAACLQGLMVESAA